MSRALRRTRSAGTPWAESAALASRARRPASRRASATPAGLEDALERRLAHGDLVGEPHAERRQHAGERMTENVLDAERIRHLAGVLTARSAEALQGVARHVVTARHGDALDRVRHAADRDPQGTRRGLLAADGEARTRAHALRELAETRLRRGPIERLAAVGTENLRKMLADECARATRSHR